MDELIGLFLGWGVPFVICLDDDKAGKMAAKQYRDDWALSNEDVFTLADVSVDLSGKEVEGFLETSDLLLISNHFGIQGTPSKSQIQLFFSEMLAKAQKIRFSAEYKHRIEAFDAKFEAALKVRTVARRT